MPQAGKLPGSNVIVLQGNEWVLTYNLGGSNTLALGQPTVVLTYVGSAPKDFIRNDLVRDNIRCHLAKK